MSTRKATKKQRKPMWVGETWVPVKRGRVVLNHGMPEMCLSPKAAEALPGEKAVRVRVTIERVEE